LSARDCVRPKEYLRENKHGEMDGNKNRENASRTSVTGSKLVGRWTTCWEPKRHYNQAVMARS
jgi:hypothetical protein